MTQTQFIVECEGRLIHPSIALENEDLRNALNDNNNKEVIRLLTEEF